MLTVTSIDTSFLYSVGQQAWFCSYLVLNFFCLGEGFCSCKFVLIKNSVLNTLLIDKVSMSFSPSKNIKQCGFKFLFRQLQWLTEKKKKKGGQI